MRRPDNIARPGEADVVAWADDWMLERYPDLFHFLADTKWDDGAPRQTGTVLLLCDAGRLKAWLNDRDNQRAAWVTADSVEALFDRLSQGVKADDLDWRAAPNVNRKKR